jgi:hypothetical protein
MSSGNTLTATDQFESRRYHRVAHESTFAQDAPFSTGKRRSEIVGLRRLNLDLEHDRTLGMHLYSPDGAGGYKEADWSGLEFGWYTNIWANSVLPSPFASTGSTVTKLSWFGRTMLLGVSGVMAISPFHETLNWPVLSADKYIATVWWCENHMESKSWKNTQAAASRHRSCQQRRYVVRLR